MKKVFLIAAVVMSLVACNSGTQTETVATTDSTTVSCDSTTCDSTKTICDTAKVTDTAK